MPGVIEVSTLSGEIRDGYLLYLLYLCPRYYFMLKPVGAVSSSPHGRHESLHPPGI